MSGLGGAIECLVHELDVIQNHGPAGEYGTLKILSATCKGRVKKHEQLEFSHARPIPFV
jgi:hypothetical protein